MALQARRWPYLPARHYLHVRCPSCLPQLLAPAARTGAGCSAVRDTVGAAQLTTPVVVGASGDDAKQGKKKEKRIKHLSELGSNNGMHSELDSVAIRQNGSIKSFSDISVCATNLKSSDPGAAAREVEKPNFETTEVQTFWDFPGTPPTIPSLSRGMGTHRVLCTPVPGGRGVLNL